MESFLGLINYHRAHIKNHAELADPLYDLVKKNAGNRRGLCGRDDRHDLAFSQLKEALTSSPVLAFPRGSEEPFVLDTDASNFAFTDPGWGGEINRLLQFFTLSVTKKLL